MIKAKEAFLLAEEKRKTARLSYREMMTGNLEIVHNYVVKSAESGSYYCYVPRKDLFLLDGDVGKLCDVLAEDGYIVEYRDNTLALSWGNLI